jgi:hypothetical protein
MEELSSCCTTVVAVNESLENMRSVVAALILWMLRFAQDDKLYFRANTTVPSGVCLTQRLKYLQLIAGLDIRTVDQSRRQFNDGMDAPTHPADSPRAQLRPDRAHAQLAVERDHVDWKQHPKGMHAR